MRKFLIIVLTFLLIFGFNLRADAIGTSAKSSILINADTLRVIYQQNAMQRLPMASTTKIMTGLILAEQNTPHKNVKVTEKMVAVEGSSMGLLAGDSISYHDLLYGLMLASGNDAANVIAYSVAGSLEAFAELMNKKAEQIGMKNTHFVTPSGLDDDEHYTTAYDMAILTAYALKNDAFAQAVSCKSAVLCYGNPPYKRTITNHNKLLKTYDNAIGVKTGFTKKSGRCLVSAARRGNVTLIAVTLNDKNDWQDHVDLQNFGFSNSNDFTLSPNIPKEIAILEDSSHIELCVDNFSCGLSMGEKLEYSVHLPLFLYSRPTVNQKIGYVRVYSGDKIIKIIDITAAPDFSSSSLKINIFKKIINKFVCLIRSF